MWFGELTRFPQEDHLTDWARRDNKVTNGDRVGWEADSRRPSPIHFSHSERPGFTSALPQQQPLNIFIANAPSINTLHGCRNFELSLWMHKYGAFHKHHSAASWC